MDRRQVILAGAAAASMATLGGAGQAQQPSPGDQNLRAPFPQGGPRPDPYLGKKKVLFVAYTSTGQQTAHEASTTRSMAVLSEALRRAGFAVFLHTDTKNITKGEVWGTGDYAKGGKKQSRGRNIDFFDGIIFYVNGEPDLNDEGRRALLSFLRDDGKGLVGIHTATSAGYYWPEYGKMIGGYFDNHPWNIVDAKVIVERPDFPGMQAFVAHPRVTDEMYAMTAEPFSRQDVDVLMRLDPASVDMKNPQVHRNDADLPQAWIKNYGKGRVFYSALGHPESSWDDPRVVEMYVEAAKWATGVTTYQVRPHPRPA
jgi:type 1 glutamine amidotransferase